MQEGISEYKYCSSCGQKVNISSHFCNRCGENLDKDNLTEQKCISNPPPLMDKNYNTGVEKREYVFEGNIHKCPHCGEPLKAFEIVCPRCRFEIRGAKSSNAVKDLAEKLENATSENQRIIIIKNFPVPNTKEDIFEFMLLASSNFDASYYATHLHEEDISDAWLTKIEQCYQKAKLSFGSNSDFEKIESLYLQIKNECAEKEIKIKYEQKAQQIAKERTEKATLFKKSKLHIVIIIFAIISALCIAVAFNDGRIIAGIIAIVMFILFVVAFLMGSGVIKEKVKNMRLIPLILAFILFVPYFATYSLMAGSLDSGLNNTETFEWSNLAMGDKLPDIGKTDAEIVWDNDSVLILNFYGCNKSEFEDYIDSCKDFGYNIDVQDDGTNFTAYNSEGYYLHLQYLDWGDKELTIDLKAP
ncbi:MAG: zinc ribbon domain-containing protein [Clostridia bacterium]|nr:zinc ribbon domain-containing protein [Clostridia bacterium]